MIPKNLCDLRTDTAFRSPSVFPQAWARVWRSDRSIVFVLKCVVKKVRVKVTELVELVMTAVGDTSESSELLLSLQKG